MQTINHRNMVGVLALGVLALLVFGIAPASATEQAVLVQASMPSVFTFSMDSTPVVIPLAVGNNSAQGNQFTIGGNSDSGWTLSVKDQYASLPGITDAAGYFKLIQTSDSGLVGGGITLANKMQIQADNQAKITPTASYQTLMTQTGRGQVTDSITYYQKATAADAPTAAGQIYQANLYYQGIAN